MSSKNKLIMMGLTTILIPLGKYVLNKLVKKVINKDKDHAPEEEDSQVVSTY